MKRLQRQWDLIPTEKLMAVKANIIGCGAIGSHTSMALAKMGVTDQTLWDFDDVAIENSNSQGFSQADIGKPKVECLQRMIREHTGETINIRYEKYVDQQLSGIVIASVDSMAVRLQIWNKVKNNPLVRYYIDPRMSIEYALLYTIDPNNPDDVAMYERTLYTDDNSVQEPCTMKAVIYTAYLIAGLICKVVKDIITDGNYARNVIWDIANNDLEVYRKDHNGRDNRASQPSA